MSQSASAAPLVKPVLIFAVMVPRLPELGNVATVWIICGGCALAIQPLCQCDANTRPPAPMYASRFFSAVALLTSMCCAPSHESRTMSYLFQFAGSSHQL